MTSKPKLEDPTDLTRIWCALRACRDKLKREAAEDDPVDSKIPKKMFEACGGKPKSDHDDNTTYSLLKQVTKAERTVAQLILDGKGPTVKVWRLANGVLNWYDKDWYNEVSNQFRSNIYRPKLLKLLPNKFFKTFQNIFNCF